MEREHRRSVRAEGGRRQSIFRNPDDYERHMQSSVAVDDDPDFEEFPREEYARSSRRDDAEPIVDL